MIQENITIINELIEESCKKANRKKDDVTLIAVSKTKPVSLLQEAYDNGCRHFGENKVQELVDKYEQLPKDIKWHMIGHLQRNKVKYIVDKVSLIHSVDSFALAQEISKQALQKGVEVDILIEVNVAREATKFGMTCEEVVGLIEQVAKLPSVHIIGLMTIAPYTENAESNREYFLKLKQLSVDIMSKNIDNITVDVLSMGMSGDYQVAVECGATMVRVGTSIFGERLYRQSDKE